MYDWLIVGAGFAGSTVARQLAEAGHRVHLVDRRPHIAGNAFDELDAHGLLIVAPRTPQRTAPVRTVPVELTR